MTSPTPITVPTGDCRGVRVLLPHCKAVPGTVVKVAGWSLHRVVRLRTSKRLVLVPCRQEAA